MNHKCSTICVVCFAPSEVFGDKYPPTPPATNYIFASKTKPTTLLPLHPTMASRRVYGVPPKVCSTHAGPLAIDLSSPPRPPTTTTTASAAPAAEAAHASRKRRRDDSPLSVLARSAVPDSSDDESQGESCHSDDSTDEDEAEEEISAALQSFIDEQFNRRVSNLRRQINDKFRKLEIGQRHLDTLYEKLEKLHGKLSKRVRLTEDALNPPIKVEDVRFEEPATQPVLDA